MNKKEKEKIKISSYLSFLKESIFIPVLSCLCSNPQQELEERNNPQQFGHFFFWFFFGHFFFLIHFFFSRLSDFLKMLYNYNYSIIFFKWYYFLWLYEMESKQFSKLLWKLEKNRESNQKIVEGLKEHKIIFWDYLWIWWVLFTYNIICDCSMSIFELRFWQAFRSFKGRYDLELYH